jgi:hypothetical protein
VPSALDGAGSVRSRAILIGAKGVLMRRCLALSALTLAVGLALWSGVAAGAAHRLTTHISNISLSGCDTLVFGYSVDGKDHKIADNSKLACTGQSPTVHAQKVSYASGSAFEFYLQDTTCNATYFWDGSGTADHAAIYDSGNATYPFQVDIADAAGFPCSATTQTRIPSQGQGNLDFLADTRPG